MAAEVICIFKRNSRCIFKGGPCDQDCDRGAEIQPDGNSDTLEERLLGRNRKLTVSGCFNVLGRLLSI